MDELAALVKAVSNGCRLIQVGDDDDGVLDCEVALPQSAAIGGDCDAVVGPPVWRRFKWSEMQSLFSVKDRISP